MPKGPIYTTTLESVVSLCESTKHFRFRLVEPPRMTFKAGQFVLVFAEQNGKRIQRPYSIASSPDETETFDLCLNRVPGGFMSNYLCDLKGGETVQVQGPFGIFTLKEPPGRASAFVATGTGIAPFRSMIRWLLAHGTRQELWLFFGVRYETDILYHDEWQALVKTHPTFHYVPTISRPQTWTGLTGYVQHHLPKHLTDPTDTDVYICGLGQMVADVQQTLLGMGWPKERLHHERYD